MEERAQHAGHMASVFVCTLPSRFHASSTEGHRNPKFDRSTPRDGHHWLRLAWQRLRAQLHRRGVRIYGLRTVEPHHDATPHWNVLLFYRPQDREAIRSAFRQHFLLSESPDEPGAAERRIKEIVLDANRGGATAYIAKYISKNVDGYRVGLDAEDADRRRDATETCVLVDAWASIHGIRQFQQFGEPPVTIWRELRGMECGSTGVIEQARRAADEGDWASFTSTMKTGVPLSNGWSIDLYKAWSDKPGVFGDPLGYVVCGLKTATALHPTRDRVWTIDWTGQSESLQ